MGGLIMTSFFSLIGHNEWHPFITYNHAEPSFLLSDPF